MVDPGRVGGRGGGPKPPGIGDPPHGRTIVALVWTTLIFAACWFPRESLPFAERVSQSYPLLRPDKLVHGLLFAGFGVLWMRALPRSARARAIVVAAGLALAPITEFGQRMPWVGRDADWGDGLADVAGLFVGCFASLLMSSRGSGRRTHPADEDDLPGRARGL